MELLCISLILEWSVLCLKIYCKSKTKAKMFVFDRSGHVLEWLKQNLLKTHLEMFKGRAEWRLNKTFLQRKSSYEIITISASCASSETLISPLDRINIFFKVLKQLQIF